MPRLSSVFLTLAAALFALPFVTIVLAAFGTGWSTGLLPEGLDTAAFDVDRTFPGMIAFALQLDTISAGWQLKSGIRIITKSLTIQVDSGWRWR